MITLALAGAFLSAGLRLSPTASAAADEPESAERISIPEEKFKAVHDDQEFPGNGDVETGTGRHFSFETFRSRIQGLWFKRKALQERKLPDAAGEQIEAMQQICAEIGVTRMDDIAAALVHEGQGFLEEGNFEKARRSFEDAQKLASDLPEASFGMARARWGGGDGAMSALGEMVAGFGALLRNRSLSSALLGNSLIIGILAIASTAVLFSIAMLLRYQALVRHDLSEVIMARSVRAVSREAVTLAGWAVLMLPLLTWIAALWTPAYWLTLTFRYQKAQERTISAGLFLLLVLSAPAARSAEVLFGLAADPSARLMLASTSASYDPEQIVNLEQMADANPREPAYRFLLGSLYARGRYFQEALAQYRKVIEIDPQNYRAVNNVGNIYLRTGRPEDALKHYKAALELRPGFVPAHYNAYLAYQNMLELKKGEDSLRQAQAVDAKALAHLIDQAHARTTGEPAEALITRDEVFRRILGGGGGRGIVASIASVPSILAAVFLLASLCVGFFRGSRLALCCAKCGEAFCQRCKVGTQMPDYCTPCQHLTAARSGLSPAIRKEKILRSERLRAAQIRLARIGSIPFPGMGRLLDGRTLTGLLVCAAWCGALLSLLMRPHLLQIAGPGGNGPIFLVTVMLSLLAGSAWLMGNLGSARSAQLRAGGGPWR